ncbi:MAG: thioredoxin-dependent thiol peroxidase [Pseudanabaenaceae cyanobacterium bins.68]|nr:thioredoxin-dependent thiol peroxidase [Pseudanabaenaceae cyanobacterium bins.68]
MALAIGDLAPDFSLADQDGNLIQLSGFRGQRVVLYFYPKDNTPGCTKEACGFRDLHGEFLAKNVVVLGISPDPAKAHQKFSQKYDLPFPLLCDPGSEVATLYHSYGWKNFMGKEYMGVMRHTFVIDPDGKIAQIYLKVKPETHAPEVLQSLD